MNINHVRAHGRFPIIARGSDLKLVYFIVLQSTRCVGLVTGACLQLPSKRFYETITQILGNVLRWICTMSDNNSVLVF